MPSYYQSSPNGIQIKSISRSPEKKVIVKGYSQDITVPQVVFGNGYQVRTIIRQSNNTWQGQNNNFDVRQVNSINMETPKYLMHSNGNKIYQPQTGYYVYRT